MLAVVRIVDKRSHRASDTPPNIPGTLHRSRTSSGIRAMSSETAGETRAHTTGRCLLKQPYKQKLSTHCQSELVQELDGADYVLRRVPNGTKNARTGGAG